MLANVRWRVNVIEISIKLNQLLIMVKIVYSSEVIPVARYWEHMEMVNVCRTKFKQTFHTALFCI